MGLQLNTTKNRVFSYKFSELLWDVDSDVWMYWFYLQDHSFPLFELLGE